MNDIHINYILNNMTEETHLQAETQKQSILILLSNLISYTIQPLLIPTIAFALILFGYPSIFSDYSFKVKINLILFIGLITCLMPVLTILIMKRFGLIATIMMKKRSDRYIPMIVTTTIYTAFAFFLVTKFPINPLFSSVMVSIAFITFIATFITFFWQISAHSASIGGLLSLIFLLNIHLESEIMFAIMLLLFIIGGFVMSARLYLNAHNFSQVLAGFSLGFITNHFVILRLFGEI